MKVRDIDNGLKLIGIQPPSYTRDLWSTNLNASANIMIILACRNCIRSSLKEAARCITIHCLATGRNLWLQCNDTYKSCCQYVGKLKSSFSMQSVAWYVIAIHFEWLTRSTPYIGTAESQGSKSWSCIKTTKIYFICNQLHEMLFVLHRNNRYVVRHRNCNISCVDRAER